MKNNLNLKFSEKKIVKFKKTLSFGLLWISGFLKT